MDRLVFPLLVPWESLKGVFVGASSSSSVEKDNPSGWLGCKGLGQRVKFFIIPRLPNTETEEVSFGPQKQT